MHALLEPWSHPFMQRALLELLFVGVVGAVLGCWVVLYELAYSAESLAHALFPGLVAAALLGLPLLLGAAGGVLGAAAAPSTPAAPPASSGSPSSAAPTRPGKSACASDSALYESS